MEYTSVTAFINKAKKFGSRLDLTRIQKLCDLLGNPEKQCKFVHIAGTNGKGSTSIFIENILVAAGYKTGLFTSPFIYEFNERIQINNVPISDEQLMDVMENIVAATDKMLAEGYEHPTEFELITAAAFCYFAQQKCDLAVLEVGLGGMLDSTNVINDPLACVITSISYDHMEYLGNQLAEIAKNKCGIIKPGRPVVCYPFQKDEALFVIRAQAEKQKSRLVIADVDDLTVEQTGLWGSTFRYHGLQCSIGLVGEYQVYNAITAISAVQLLQEQGYVISDEMIQNGLKAAKWPARFEILNRCPVVIADGSHNEDGMRVFVDAVKKSLHEKNVICVFGMLKDKEYGKCLALLSDISNTIIVTEVDSPRAETAERLALEAKKYFSNVFEKPDNTEAVLAAKNMASADDVIVALGSLYMMKHIKDAVNQIFGEASGS